MPKKSKKGSASTRAGYYYMEDDRYCWRLRPKGCKPIVVKRATEEERDREITARLAELDKTGSRLKKGEDPTVSQHFRKWLETKIKPYRAQRTYESYRDVFEKHIEPVLGNVKLSKVGAEEVQSMIAAAQAYRKPNKKPLAPRSVQYVGVVFFIGMGKRRTIEFREDVELPEGGDARDRILSEAEIQELLEELFRSEPQTWQTVNGKTVRAAPGTVKYAYRHRFLILYLLNTALRISEALGCMQILVNTRENYIQVTHQLARTHDEKGNPTWYLKDLKSKAGKRIVPLNPVAIDAVKGQLHQVSLDIAAAGAAYENHGLLFATESGEPLWARNVIETIYRAVKAINVRREAENLPPMPHVTLHDLRRSYLTHLARFENRPQVIKSIAGHASIETTHKHYIWALEADKKEAAAKISLGGSLPFRKIG